jgi:ABC-2 type transport system permease protein
MSGSYVAELVKLRKRSTTWVLFGTAMVLSMTFGYLIPYLGYVSGDDNIQTQGVPRAQVLADMLPGGVVGNAMGGFPVFAGALALVLGALLVGSEYGWGTVRTVLTQGPNRFTVLAAQLAALVTVLAGWVLGNFTASGIASTAIALAEGESMNWPGPVSLLTGAGAGLLVLTTWAMVGAVLALVLRGVALPIGLGVVWVLGIEALFVGVAGSVLPELDVVTHLLPGVNAGSLVYAALGSALGDAPPGVTDAVSGTRALVTLFGYLLVAGVLAATTVRRRDVA